MPGLCTKKHLISENAQFGIYPIHMYKQILTLLKKDVLLEFRQKHTFYGILLYITSTIFVLYLSTDDTPSSKIWNGLFWTIQLFICVNAVAKSFLQESKGRMLYYQTLVSPTAFITSKLVYNIILMSLMSAVSYLLFSVFLGNPTLSPYLFLTITLLGGMGLSLVFTLMSAIAAKAQQNAALIAILGFPVILPELMLTIRLSSTTFGEVFREGAVSQLMLITLGLDVLVIALALILFPFLWKD